VLTEWNFSASEMEEAPFEFELAQQAMTVVTAD
jgi:hypothetical protein